MHKRAMIVKLTLVVVLSLQGNQALWAQQVSLQGTAMRPLVAPTTSTANPTVTPTYTATPIPTTTPTPTPEPGWLNDPRASVIGAVLSLLGALTSAGIALISTLVGRRQFKEQLAQQRKQFQMNLQQHHKELIQKQHQFEEQMRLEWDKHRREHPPSPGESALGTVQSLLADFTPSISEVYGTPYIVGPPIDNPKNFYNRTSAVTQIYELIQGTQMLSASVLGVRRSGKTSLLRYVSHPEVQHSFLGSAANSYLLVCVDLQADIREPSGFYRYLMSQANAALAHKRKQALPEPLPMGKAVLGDLATYLDETTEAGLRVVFLLDEFERLVGQGAFERGFLEGLRSLITGRHLAWIISSYHDLYQVGRSVGLPAGSDFFNIFYPEPIYIGAFEDEDARKLVTEPATHAGITFTPEEVGFVIKLAGRMPHALQMAASLLFSERKTGQSIENALASLESKFRTAMDRHFKHYWEGLDDIQKNVLSCLAKGDSQELTSHIQKHGDDALKCLLDYSIIQATDEGYSVSGRAFAQWIRCQLE